MKNMLLFCILFTPLSFLTDLSEKSYAVEFSANEQNWLNQLNELRFSEVEWHPLSYTSEYPVYKGIIADYLEILREKTGLKLKYIKSSTWQEVLDKYKNNKIDIIPALAKEDEVGAEVVLSDPYISFPLVIATRPDTVFIGNTDELNGKKVGVGEGYTSYNFLKKNYPEIQLITVDNVSQGLKLLEKEAIYAFVGHMAVVVDTIRHDNLDLVIAGKTEYIFEHRMGMAPKHALTVLLFNKIFQEITPEEHNRIYNKWVKINIDKTDYSIVWKVLLGAFILISGFIYWNRKLSAEKKRTQDLLEDLNILKIQLEEKNAELSELAITDQLTGLCNRLKLNGTFEKEINRSLRYNRSFGIILIDIDYFKEINDTWGHQTGDKILICFSDLLKSNTRKTDIIGRWGGEEFLIICPEINSNSLIKLAEKLRSIIERFVFPEINSRTASFGLAIYEQADDNKEKMILRADEALYKAKANGRNSVVFK